MTHKYSQLSSGLWYVGMRSVFSPFPVGQVAILQSYYLESMTKYTTSITGSVIRFPKSFSETCEAFNQSIHQPRLGVEA